ncbi:MAG: cell division protein ZapA [Saprospiraceae bacterium]
MQEDDLKTVKITIAGRVFPVKVTPEEDLIVRDLEEEINSKVNDFQHTYPGRDKLDCVIMTLLTYTFDQNKSKYSENDQLVSEQINKIKTVLNISDLH